MAKELKIDLSYLPVINFAMQQNHVPVIREISLKNTGDELITDITLTVDFDPQFAAEYTTKIDRIIPGGEERISVVPIVISTDFLSNLTERISGTIKSTARASEDILAECQNEISILTYNEWCGESVMPAMIAAFCTPNHPGVIQINKRASEILNKWTGDPSLNAYQTRNHNRVKYQMAAVYEAISEKDITYCVAPASFEKHGQRIRTIDEILATKMGNCLDMTMFYVSCLEAIGLHPLILLNSAHAYAGCWLIPDTFAECANDDPSLITKRIAEGINEILVVECTAMNQGCVADMDTAINAAKQKLAAEDFVMSIDICRARASQIRPLPIRTVDDNGRYVVEEEDITRHTAAPVQMSATDLIIDDPAKVNKKTIWERKLLDLTLNNSLLNLKLRQSTIPFISVDVNMLEDDLSDSKEFTIHPKPTDWDGQLLSDGIYKALNATDPLMEEIRSEMMKGKLHSYMDKDQLVKAQTQLYRSSRTSMEENGANTLYLALGLLKWYETPSSEKARYAPVLLIPVELVRKSASSGYTMRSRDEDVMLNITLLEYLRQTFDITIGGLDPLPKDDSGIDTSLVFNTIRRKIMEQKNWDVLEQAVLGNFSFSKFIMWNDIHNNTELLCQSKIVSSLMDGVVDEEINTEIQEEGDLDEKVKAGDIILPISADSSQIEAITSALSGKSFILHGPPGTGKSQTITNIIANALYKGKKVLFVAEKMAALEVVQNRLNSIGLAPFCLELHSNKTKKSNVMAQFKKTTEVVKTKSVEEYKIEAQQINSVRDEMNNLIKALHKPYPVGLSLYDCVSRYVSINEECPCFDLPLSKAEKLTSDIVARMEIALSELKAALDLIGNPAEHPLQGIRCTEYSAESNNALASLPKVIEIIDSLEKKLSCLRNLILKSKDSSITKEEYDLYVELAYILDNDGVHTGFVSESITSITATEDIIEHGKLRDTLHKELLGQYDEGIFEIDAKAYETEWREVLSKGFFTRFFAKRKFLRKLATYTIKKVESDNVLKLLKTLGAYQKENNIVSEFVNSHTYIKKYIRSNDTDWDKILRSCKFAKEVRNIVNTYAPDNTEHVLNNISSLLDKEGNRRFLDIYNEHTRLNEALAKALNKLGADLNTEENFIFSSRSLLDRWYNAKDKLRYWIIYNKHIDNIRLLGFNEMAELIDCGNFGSDSISEIFYKTLYKTYAEYILSMEPELQLFNGTMFEEKIKRFRGLCKDFEQLTKEELFAQVASTLPALQKEAAQSSEVGILQRNIRNGCRGISLRNFFASITDLLPRICPCMLMSPISVAQYINAEKMKFDLVIFDEASQMPTCEAVGAIARGKSIIVVGDPNQLPPTNFFNANSFDEDNVHIEDLESILDDCLALTLPSKYLIWHYRSKHESLIAFSNCKYYNNKLHTFPSPDDIQTKIGYQYVVGTYDRGGSRQNKAEAQAIINEIRHRLQDPALSKKSIGVVTFNTNQQSLLEDLLNEMFVKNPALEKIALECEEPIFIKNLENVQGDERDVILFSVGYGQDKEGKIMMNFGPLNQDGGWRRLNVAVSRARYEMKVFSSLKSEQIDLRRTASKGVAGLKEFLEYAEKGEVSIYNNSSFSVLDDGFVEAVAKAIRDNGYEVRTNIGSSGYKIDIGVVNPADNSSYVLGILCDGYNYTSSRSARDREIIQVGVLRKLGWNIWRIWSIDWWTDRDKAMNDLLSKIKESINGEFEDIEEGPLRLYSNTNSVTATTFAEEQETEVVEGPESDIIIPYTTTELENRSLPTEDVVNGYYDSMLKDYVNQVVETEAPINKELLCKRVLRAINIARMGPRVAYRMQCILESLDLKTTTGTDNVYWKKDQNPATYSLIRCSNERDALHIPAEEAKNAAVYILSQQGAQPAESLIREMAKVFGYSRAGDNVYTAMLQGIELACHQSLIDKSNNERVALR